MTQECVLQMNANLQEQVDEKLGQALQALTGKMEEGVAMVEGGLASL